MWEIISNPATWVVLIIYGGGFVIFLAALFLTVKVIKAALGESTDYPLLTCKHGKGLTEYCQPCGRINGG